MCPSGVSRNEHGTGSRSRRQVTRHHSLPTGMSAPLATPRRQAVTPAARMPRPCTLADRTPTKKATTRIPATGIESLHTSSSRAVTAVTATKRTPRTRRSSARKAATQPTLEQIRDQGVEAMVDPTNDTEKTSKSESPMDETDNKALKAADVSAQPKSTNRSSKRVLVDRDVFVPLGKRLKRTVRVEKHTVPIPEEMIRSHALAVSRIQCRNLFRKVSGDLQPAEALRIIVDFALNSDYARSFCSKTAQSVKNLKGAASRSLAYLDGDGVAVSHPTRRNPVNDALRTRLTTLRAVAARRRAELKEWRDVRRQLDEMPARRVKMPTPAVSAFEVPEVVRVNNAEQKSRSTVEDLVLHADKLDVGLRSLGEEQSTAGRRVRALVDDFNSFISTVTLAKTPRKPKVFPRGGGEISATP